jgi:hypothetical protein
VTATVTFEISGAAWAAAVIDGGWPADNPTAAAIVESSPWRAVGKGRRYTVTLPRSDASDLADYLWSVAEVNEVGEGRDSKVVGVCRRAVDAIVEALR